MSKKSYVDCECYDMSHVIRLTYDEIDGNLIIESRLNQFRPWYERVYFAFLYIFGFVNHRDQFDSTLIHPKKFQLIRDILVQAESVNKN